MSEKAQRDQMVNLCRCLFQRGFSVGTAGNVSVRLPDGLLVTPTNARLGDLEADTIAKLDLSGRHIGGDTPTKEVFLHQAMLDTRRQAGAVVHLHSTWATALSCADDVDEDDCVPPITPYVVMRVGPVKRIPYVRPGDPKSGDLIRALNGQYGAILLANHGPVVSGRDLFSAVCAAEELEETAKLLFAMHNRPKRFLSPRDVEELESVFGGTL